MISRGCVCPMAAWMRFVRAKAVKGEPITDPLADQLLAVGARMKDADGDVELFTAMRGVFPEALAKDERVVTALKAAYRVSGVTEIAKRLRRKQDAPPPPR